MRRCGPDSCIDACGYPPSPQCEDDCDMDCVAKDGEWIVTASWMVQNADVIDSLIRKVKECRE